MADCAWCSNTIRRSHIDYQTPNGVLHFCHAHCVDAYWRHQMGRDLTDEEFASLQGVPALPR